MSGKNILKCGESREKRSGVRYVLSDHGPAKFLTQIGGEATCLSATIWRVDWLQDGRSHWSEYPTMIAEKVRQPEAGILCGLLNEIVREGYEQIGIVQNIVGLSDISISLRRRRRMQR